MARIASIKLACLNFTIHPEPSPEKYLKIFNDLLSQDQQINVRKKFVKLSNHKESIEKELIDGFLGSIEVCTNINTKLPFYDTEKSKAIVDKDGSPIPQLKSNIKPEYKKIYFVFYPKYHRLIFDCKLISPNTIYYIFEKLVANLKSDNQDITVILEKDNERIERIKEIEILEVLEIFISLPNGDSFRNSIEAKIDGMNKQNVHSFKQTKKAISNTGIVKSDDDIDWLDMSLSYGVATGKGKDKYNKKVQYTTAESPIIKSFYPDVVRDLAEQVLENAKIFIKEFIGRLN